MPSVAIVGIGLIGRSWAIVFARAGWDVRITDPSAEQLAAAPGLIRRGLDELAAHGLQRDVDAATQRVFPVASLINHSCLPNAQATVLHRSASTPATFHDGLRHAGASARAPALRPNVA